MPVGLRLSDLTDLVAGDRIAFRLASYKGQTRIDRGRLLSAAPRGGGPAVSASTVAVRVGDAVPDFSLTSHHGGPVSLSSLRGKVVAIAFVYTRCHLPDFCPRMMTNFRAVKQRFAGRLNRDVVLLTVTFDPQVRHGRDAAAVRATLQRRRRGLAFPDRDEG